MQVLIIGGGIGGLCLAHGLKQSGVEVSVYERELPERSPGENYTLQINASGNRALHASLPADLWTVYAATMGAPVHGLRFMTEKMRSLASVDWELPSDPVTADCRVSRARLVQILRTGLQNELHMGKKLVRYAHVGARVEACFEDGSRAAGDVLIGADGVASSVRKQLLPTARVLDLDIVGLGGKCAPTPDSRQWLPATLVENMNVVLPPAGRGMFVTSFVRPPAAPTAPDGAYAELLAPDLADHVFWALIARRGTFGLEGARHPADPAHLKALALRLVDTWHPKLQRLVAETESSALTAIPLQTAAPVAPWQTRNVTLLGDAVHTMPPLQGLGGNTALRDASLLRERLVAVSRGQADLLAALHSYEAEMLEYSFAAMRASLAQTHNFVSANRFGREIFKGVLLVADAIPPLKQHMFRKPAE